MPEPDLRYPSRDDALAISLLRDRLIGETKRDAGGLHRLDEAGAPKHWCRNHVCTSVSSAVTHGQVVVALAHVDDRPVIGRPCASWIGCADPSRHAVANRQAYARLSFGEARFAALGVYTIAPTIKSRRS